MPKTYPAAKRPIRSVRNVINDLISTSVGGGDLFIASESITVIRTIIDICVVRSDVGLTGAVWQMMVKVDPNNVSVLEPTIAQGLVSTRPQELIWETGGIANRETAVGDVQIDRIYRDIKGMRKLKVGDRLRWSHLGSIANSFSVVGIVTQFFKEN